MTAARRLTFAFTALGLVFAVWFLWPSRTDRTRSVESNEAEGWRTIAVPPAAVSPKPAAKPAQPSPPPAEITFVVEDLLDGRPLPAFRLQCGDQKTPVTTNENGRAKCLARAPVAPADERWKIVGNRLQPQGEDEPHVAHAFHLVKLTGSVALPPDMETPESPIHVRFDVVDDRADQDVEAQRLISLEKAGVRTHGGVELEEGSSTYEALVPRTSARVAVLARSRALYSDLVEVSMDRTTSEARADLQLKHGVLLRGVLRDEQGAPLAGIAVMVYVTRIAKVDEVPALRALATARARNAGMTYNAGADGRGIVTFIYYATTDERGRYAVPFYPDGDVYVRAHVPGRRPAAADLGRLREHKELPLVAAKPASAGSVLILLDGTPVRGQDINVSEMVRGGPQMTARTKTDADGRISNAWYTTGRHYVVSVGPDAEFIEWRNQDRINIVPLKKKGHQVLPTDWFD